MKLTANLKKAPLGPLLVIRYLNLKVPIKWGDETRLLLENAKGFGAESFIFRYLCLKTPGDPFLGSSLLERCEVDSWITFSLGPLSCERKYVDSLNYLNTSLSSVTYLVGNVLTAADIAVWAKLAANKNWNNVVPTHMEVPTNVHRWFSLIGNLSSVKDVLTALPSNATMFEAKDENLISSRKEEGKFVELPGAESGKVIVRFPPEASGYLHIGHAKAALLNQYYRDAFKGKLIMRFDDTNPAKEKVDFEKVILEDLKLLKVDYEIYSHTSDHFDLLLEKCEQLLKSGKAYVDDTDPEIMKQEREQKLESKNRSNSVEKNLTMWSEMKAGSQKGQKCCVRAKIDMQSLNGCMRDPTIYRCKNEPHPKTGSKYKVYPTYDFACPIVDSIEGVTHSLRTMEYHDRDEQFYWFTDALGLRKPYIWEYSRLNMTNTVLSKRKLTWFVENSYVDGWDDPRMPTVRGVLRRGMTVEGLKQFITAQGSSRSVVFMEWDKIWAINKKVIDPVAPRYTAVDEEHKVPILIQGISEQEVKAMKHPKNPDVGEKTIWLAPKIWIDKADAVVIKEGENVTLINWGNVTIKTVKKKNNKIEEIIAVPNFEDKNYKKTLKLTWLSDTTRAKCIECICVYYDFLISKPILGKDEDFKNFIKQNTKTEVRMIGDPELASVKKSDIIQLQRKGFFICDVPYSPPSIHTGKEMPIVLFYIPDGHTKEIPTAIPNALKDKAITKPVIGESSDVVLLNNDIVEQGNKVRNVKQLKAEKTIIAEEVGKLLKLKELFKTLTGQDWKLDIDLTKFTTSNTQKEPNASIQTESKQPQDALKVHADILEQGNTVRKLKDLKADKNTIKEEVGKLLKLKELFKVVTGQDWKQDFDLTKYTAGSVKKEPEVSLQTESKQPQDALKVHADILEQGNTVRKLKDQKADKNTIKEEVGKLLKLKELFKVVTGQDWKPDLDLTKYTTGSVKKEPEVSLQTESKQPQDALKVHADILEQGNTVRKLKDQKADKNTIKEEVGKLLKLKELFKVVTGQDWKPDLDLTKYTTGSVKKEPEVSLQTESKQPQDALKVHADILEQGNTVRKLKEQKADKKTIGEEVGKLLKLKELFKVVTGQDWKPDLDLTKYTTGSVKKESKFKTCPLDALKADENIQQHLKYIRELELKNIKKELIDEEIEVLFRLKNFFKTVTGQDWKPGMDLTKYAIAVEETNKIYKAEIVQKDIVRQGEMIRELKQRKVDKSTMEQAINLLLKLKGEYKALSGKEYVGENEGQNRKNKPKKEKSEQTNAKKKEKSLEKDSVVKKVTRLGIEALKEENLPDWYSQVIVKGELIEYYDVSGCYILRPWSFAIWEALKDFFDKEIKLLGVKNCYFPIFVSRSVLEKEKSHIADFAPEVAWVTKSGNSDLAEHIAIRPTSETVMYPAYAKWIQSHRDLPIKLNQWNNVVRWEFKHPQPFLRTREFLWQEGHTAYADKEEAEKEVECILDLYGKIYTDLLAIPVVKGRKTEKEKFAGGDYTLTVEAYISASGRAIQGATSHHLGQNFSKMFDIVYEDPETQEKKFVYQNSWGFTTRTIGVMIMVHADNQGLVLPPRVASVQVVIVPCGITASLSEIEKEKLLKTCRNIEVELKESGVRVEGDYRDNYSPGWKFNHWELKGVPVRVEVGPKDLQANQIVTVRRDTGAKTSVPMSGMVKAMNSLLENIHQSMLKKSTDELNANKKLCTQWDEFCELLDKKCLLLSPFCGEIKCEEEIKEGSTRADSDVDTNAPSMGAKSLCIPLEQPQPGVSNSDKCINPKCYNKPKFYTLFGRSY